MARVAISDAPTAVSCARRSHRGDPPPVCSVQLRARTAALRNQAAINWLFNDPCYWAGCGRAQIRNNIENLSLLRIFHPCSAVAYCAECHVMAFDLSMQILVVDDYNTMIRIIRNLLKQIGFENVDDASDGSAALAKMQAKKYGLVISDWNMEPMTGYDLLKEVRADPNLATTPFIMITAESKTENVIAAKKAGVSNYIVKPFNAATLKTKMEAVFGPSE